MFARNAAGAADQISSQNLQQNRSSRGSLSRHPDGAGGHGSFPGMHAVMKQSREGSGVAGSHHPTSMPTSERRASLQDGHSRAQQALTAGRSMAGGAGVVESHADELAATGNPVAMSSR